jgi:hypothetical protein
LVVVFVVAGAANYCLKLWPLLKAQQRVNRTQPVGIPHWVRFTAQPLIQVL